MRGRAGDLCYMPSQNPIISSSYREVDSFPLPRCRRIGNQTLGSVCLDRRDMRRSRSIPIESERCIAKLDSPRVISGTPYPNNRRYVGAILVPSATRRREPETVFCYGRSASVGGSFPRALIPTRARTIGPFRSMHTAQYWIK
jgi:hypothetical protein